jgi:hypothetical protein
VEVQKVCRHIKQQHRTCCVRLAVHKTATELVCNNSEGGIRNTHQANMTKQHMQSTLTRHGEVRSL